MQKLRQTMVTTRTPFEGMYCLQEPVEQTTSTLPDCSKELNAFEHSLSSFGEMNMLETSIKTQNMTVECSESYFIVNQSSP